MKQLYLLIEEGIYHVDLHPGNVLVDNNHNVYVIDFDKARCWTGPKNELRDLYLHRWRRAVIKHNLPETLSEIACLHLRYNFGKKAL
jgi:3-deoxy-D-manno-octulosonic acid kinase